MFISKKKFEEVCNTEYDKGVKDGKESAKMSMRYSDMTETELINENDELKQENARMDEILRAFIIIVRYIKNI